MKTLTVTCLDEQEATRFADSLIRLELDGVTRKGRAVSVPWGGDPRFCMDLFQAAVDAQCADDHEAATQMQRALASLPGAM